MSTRLAAGQYFGSVLRRMQLASALITETRHPPREHIPTHAHRAAYFCFVRRGSYVETYGTWTRDCRPLSVTFHPPEEPHSERMGDDEVRSMNVEVTPALLARVQAAVPRLREPVDTRGGTPGWLAVRLYDEFQSPDAASPLAAEGLILELAAELGRAAERPADAPRWLSRIRELLCDRFRENVSLAELAAEAGVHPVHLAGVFRRCVGCTVGEFVRARRLENAATLLARPSVTLAAAAAAAGFSDQSHLTRLFKRATGLTPAQYRKQALT